MPGGASAGPSLTRLFLGCLLVSAPGCGDGEGALDASVTTDGGPLESCVIGAWERPSSFGECGCVGPRPAAECDAPDCEKVHVLVMRESGSFWESTCERSSSRATFTVVDTCPPVPTVQAYTWRATTGGWIVQEDMFGGGTTFEAACSGDRLVTHELYEYHRAPAGFIDGAEDAFASGDCAGTYAP